MFLYICQQGAISILRFIYATTEIDEDRYTLIEQSNFYVLKVSDIIELANGLSCNSHHIMHLRYS